MKRQKLMKRARDSRTMTTEKWTSSWTQKKSRTKTKGRTRRRGNQLKDRRL